MFNLYPLLIPCAPLLAALISSLAASKSSNANYKIARLIMFTGLFSAALVLYRLIQSPEPIHLVLMDLPSTIIPVFELNIDRLSAVMMFVISGFGTLLYHYSTRYLQQDAGQSRYQTLLALAVSSLLFMVSSADLVTLFVFWQVLSWFLCLLSHNFAHIPTAQSSFRTFIMLRLGDLAFLAGIVLCYQLYGTVQFANLFEAAALDHTQLAFAGVQISAATVITLLIFVGAMSKSAQFPLHMWLPDSLYAPTPIHALLHAGIINAGGFLLNRLAPLYILSSITLHVVLVIGLATTILGTSMMLVQNDIKKTLGYSTIGQMGYMIMECGLGAFGLAVFHLIAHGLFKADIFLNCGKGIQEARQEPYSPGSSEHKVSGWFGPLLISLLIPLAITLGVHYWLGISFQEHQGLFVLMLFSWVTASQAALTLFKVKTTSLTKGGMLVFIALIATVYFFAAESFTHFLNPEHGVVDSYFQAAKLPHTSFLLLSVLLILAIVGGWFYSLAPQQSNRGWYLFFANRLYLDAVALRLHEGLKSIGKKLDRSLIATLLVLATSVYLASQEQNLLTSLSVLAIAAALWGSIKALVQVSISRLLVYAGLAQFAIPLWFFAQSGELSPELLSSIWSVATVWLGLVLIWSISRNRFGTMDLNQLGGLFQTMPRFALFTGLVIMAAVGLPPFSLFFSHLGIVLSPSTGISAGLLLVLGTWFAACWYLFDFMRQLLFGPAREDLRYEDLGTFETITFLLVIALLLVPSNISQIWLMEGIQWLL